MTGTDRRSELAALFGGVLSIAVTAVLAWLGLWTGSDTFWAASFQAAGVIGIWFLSWTQIHQLRLIAEEKLEVAELERQRSEKLAGAQTIFAEDELDQMEKLAMGRRLRSLEKYLIPFVALLIAAVHVVGGLMLWGYISFTPLVEARPTDLDAARPAAFFALGIAFGCFMYSRYAIGMSRLPGSSALRASGNYLFGAASVCLAVFVVLLCAMSGMDRAEGYLTRAVGILLFVLAGEIILNYIFDFYRPRIAGEVHRPFYDSRLLGIFSEPGGILNSLAKSVDYQFGFKVSETWFYKLLGRAIVPLLIVQIAVIFLLTTIVVVPPGHQAVIEHFGKPRTGTAGPGLHITWPWPIDQADIIPVERVQRIEVGYESDDRDAHGELGAPVLWTQKHYAKEYLLLVGDKEASASTKLPINLLSVNMPVQWRVKDSSDEVLRYHRQSGNVASIVESIAYRELTRYAAQADLQDLLGAGGIKTAEVLWQRVQAACDKAGLNGEGLGVQIVNLGIGGIHPPQDEETARAFEEVVNAFEKRDTAILKALGDAAMMRAGAGGAVAPELHAAILDEEKALAAGAPDADEKTARVELMLLRDAGGSARIRVGEALRGSYGKIFEDQASAERLLAQLPAYKSSPEVFMLRSYLRMLTDGLQKVTKYVIAVEDPTKVRINLDLKATKALDVLGAELQAVDAQNVSK